ncbi:hypothetical protein EG68_00256 [Paragonimus skrjabini miyazakii]|uniref:Peregrin n=1 Tax=Paragonimus skrjabini miyazakii TaxID=59628 RepID=A0A8S9ZCT9_9TREM|nr:hypothetical protein EG68_00256 [Paragonimus skrjabini miyazakii]
MEYHPVDFDIDDFLLRIQGNKPPFICPAETCKKVHKSYAHMQKHMLIHRPLAPIDIPALPTDVMNSVATHGLPTNLKDSFQQPKKGISQSAGTMLHTDSRCYVVFGPSAMTQGLTFRCSIFVPLTFRIDSNREVTTLDHHTSVAKSGAGDTAQTTVSVNKIPSNRIRNKMRNSITRSGDRADKCPSTTTLVPSYKADFGDQAKADLKLPKPVYEVDSEFSFKKTLNIKDGHCFIRFIEKSSEELDEIVEYDLDEEDLFWLERLNKERSGISLPPVCEETLEWIMDRFEKEAKFRLVAPTGNNNEETRVTPGLSHSGIDEDAVCAVCQDGTCENTNVILFCDVCNLAVHQECYGVPYVPEGPWLCRKCLHSPSEPVSCVLCPNRDGAFKKTADDRWAHVICGLWVPEVMFANLTFLEPLEGIDKIAPARWKLQCFICKQRNVGACIQCHKPSCYRAFHVTCAQHAGLYMKIEHLDDEPGDAGIRKNAFCDHHCPPNHFTGSNKSMYANSDTESPQSPEQAARIQLRKARKVLAERRNSKPSICVPIVPKARIDLMASKLTYISGDVMAFLHKAYTFWKLKREFRRGVPLLKRLQACSIHRSAANFAAAATTGDVEAKRMRAQLQFWQQLRQDLEKARLLSELTRKRERVKRELFRLFTTQIQIKIQSIDVLLLRLLDHLQALDKQNFFAEPVGPDLAPDYHLIIKHPMDFSTMRANIQRSVYTNVAAFEADYRLMLNNCFRYNRRDSVYYVAATRMLEQAKPLIEEAMAAAEQAGISTQTGLLSLDDYQEDMTEPTIKISNPVDYSLHVKENCISVQSSDEATLQKPTNTDSIQSLLQPSDPKAHSPLKELANAPRELTVACSTRGRLSSIKSAYSNFPKFEQYSANGHLRPIQLPTRRSRKRRFSPGNYDSTSPSFLSLTDGGRPTKQERIDLSLVVPNGENIQWNTVQTKMTDLFSGGLPAINSSIKTPQWTCGASASTSLESSNILLDQSADVKDDRPRNKELNGVVRNGPAFTRYRLTRSTRCEDDDEEDEESSDEEEDSSDNLFDLSISAVSQRQNDDRLRRSYSRTKPGSHPVVLTTVVGKSRMASSSLRRLLKGPKKRTKRLRLTASGANSSRGHKNRSRRIQRSSLAPTSKRVRLALLRTSPNLNEISPDQEDYKNVPLRIQAITDDDSQKPAHSFSLTTELSDDACSHLESPGPLSTSTSIEPQEFFHPSSEIHSVPGSPCCRNRLLSSASVDAISERQIGPLDVVWAKCRGSPWYPGLVVDPTAKEGYSHNGVPVPYPPESVLNWAKRSNFDGQEQRPDLLVLFFDTKRTWQWLPHYKVHLLGYSLDADRERLREGRRSKMKNSVLKAYRRAVEHLCKVHGRPYPYSDCSKSNDLAVFTL